MPSGSSEFKSQCCATSCAGVSLLLHPQRAAFWPATKTLLLADVHLGKEQVFSRAGNPIPAGPSEADIDRLDKLVEQSGAARLLILGDLIHARPNRSERWLDKLSTFLNNHQQLSVEVVVGNHDKPEGQLLTRTGNRFTGACSVWSHTPVLSTQRQSQR